MTSLRIAIKVNRVHCKTAFSHSLAVVEVALFEHACFDAVGDYDDDDDDNDDNKADTVCCDKGADNPT